MPSEQITISAAELASFADSLGVHGNRMFSADIERMQAAAGLMGDPHPAAARSRDGYLHRQRRQPSVVTVRRRPCEIRYPAVPDGLPFRR